MNEQSARVTSDRPDPTGPAGWVTTAVGGAIGGAAGGFLTMMAAIPIIERGGDDGLEGLVTAVIWTCIGAVVFGGAGATAALGIRGHERPVASGVLFAIFYAICAVGFFAAVATFTPDWDGQVWMTVVGLVSLVISALASRAIVTRGSAPGQED